MGCNSFEHDAVEVEDESNRKESSSKSSDKGAGAKATKESTIWNSKVILMSGISEDALAELASEKGHDDKVVHLHNCLRFAVLRKDHNFFAAGGPWDKVLDGGDPATDESALIRTAVRCFKQITQLDLSSCQRWNRFVEVHYDRVGKDGLPSYKEITVIFLPDLSPCLPSLESWQAQWLVQKQARLEREREVASRKEKKEKASDKKDVLKGTTNGIKGEKESKSADKSKKEKDGKKEKEKKDEKKEEEKKDEKKEEKRDENKELEEKKEENKEKKNDETKEEEKKVEKRKDEKKVKEEKKSEKKKDEKEKEEKKETKKDEKEDKHEAKKDGEDGSKGKKKDEKRKENKDKDLPKEKKDKGRSEELPPYPGLFLTTKWSKDFKIRSMTLSLDGLLDYNDKDSEESTFELSLFAEAFQEMLQYQMGSRILASLEVLRQSTSMKRKNDRKRPREDKVDKEEEGQRKSTHKRLKVSAKQISDGKGDGDSAKPDKGDGNTSEADESISKGDQSPSNHDAAPANQDAAQPNQDEEKMDNGSDEKEVEEDVKDDDVEMKDAPVSKEPSQEEKKEDKEDQKDKVAKPDVSVKKTVIDKELLKAYRYFDRNRVGYIKVDDLRRILHSLGKFLSNRNVKELVSCALSESNKARDERILYLNLVKQVEL